MVLLSDKKYACETCIKGHRSSACKHTDRPLFEIKKKGRPVTQCEHCRELRKTKQVHVKCLCGVQDLGAPVFEASHSKKWAAKLPTTATFPHGLPENLEAIAILPAASDGSIDSDHSGETSPSGCRCSKGESCECCTPRKPAGRRRSSGHQDMTRGDRNHHSHHSESNNTKDSSPPQLSSHVLARIAELRPVLPRPPRNHPSTDGPLHNPSSGIPHSSRHHIHENVYYSPYGRAYEHIHTHEHPHDHKTTLSSGDTRASPVRQQIHIQQNMVSGTQPAFDAWQSAQSTFPSACTCGDSCRCPGCSEHNSAPVPPGGAYSSCTNPASCSFCLDCTILSLPPSSAPPSFDPASDPQNREFEDWLKQVSAPTTNTTNPVGMQSTFSPYELSMNQMATFSTPNLVRSPQLPSSAENYCSSRCNCPSGSCSCAAGGGCQGCECERCCGSGSRTTFAVSGERGSCCDKPQVPSSSARMPHRNTSARLPDYMAMTAMQDGLAASTNVRNAGLCPNQANYLSVTEAPSRSSSSSSLSSRMSGRSPINANSPGIFHNAPSVGSRSSQSRTTTSTNGYDPYAQPQTSRTGGQYDAYPGFNPMQYPQ